MALQKQVVPVTLAGGLDTKTDPKQVQPGKLLIADNVVMQKTGELSKVDGTTTLNNGVFGSSPITSGKQLSVLGSELCLASNDSFYGYGSGPGAWNYKAKLSNCSVGTKPVASGTRSYKSPVSGVANNVALHAWIDGSAVVYMLVDLTSGSVIVAPTTIANSVGSPRVIVQGQYILLSWLTSGAVISMLSIDSLNPAIQTTFQVTAGSGYNGNYDIAPFQGGFAIVYMNSTFDLYGLVGSVTGSVIVPVINLGINVGGSFGDTGTSLFVSDTGLVLGLLYSATASLNHVSFTAGFVVNTAPIVVFAAPCGRFSAVCYNSVSEIFYSLNSSADPAIYAVFRATVVHAGNAVSAGQILKGSFPTSRAFRVNNVTLLMAGYENYFLSAAGAGTEADQQPLQTTNFLIDFAGNTQAAILPAKSGNLFFQFANPVALSSEKVLISVLQKGRLISESGRLFNLDTVSAVTLDFSAKRFAPGQTLGQNLYLSGGYLRSYDGVSLVEAGFHLWPDYKTTDANPFIKGAAGSIAPGKYLYRAVYEWRDANGQVHQSAPTFPPHTETFASGETSISLKFRALAFTDKRSENGLKDVSVVLYRTKKDGSTYYRVTLPTSPVLNDTAARLAGYVTLTDTLSDTDLGNKQILYTVGGELENVAVPSPSVVLAFKNRIFTVTGEDPSALYYSKQIVQEQIPGFNETLRLPVTPQYGDIMALGALDDKLVIFKSSAIYVIAGDGPLPNGLQDTFSEPAKLASDVGCSNQSSVVETPLGLMFQSAKGIYLLDRSLQVKYIGAQVDAFNSLTVSGAFVLPYANEVRMSTAEGTTLVYDYEQNVWTTRTNEPSVGAVAWKGKAVFLKSNGRAGLETLGQAATDNAPVLTKVKTSFHSFASLQGFQRVWRILVLGKFVGNHVLKVTLFTDYKDTADDTFYIAVGDAAFLATASVQAVTTQAALFNGSSTDPQYQFSIKPRVQKCESLSVQIEDVFPTGVGTKAFNISNISFEVGSKGVSKRLSASTTLAKG